MADYTDGPWSTTESYSHWPTDSDPQMMSYEVLIEAIAPFTDDVPGSDQYGETFEEQAVAKAYGRTAKEALANAGRIVRCVNSHEALVSALNKAHAALNGGKATQGLLSEIEAALRSAGT